jgi:hypothetical protein
MSNYPTAFALFAVAVIIAIVAAFVTTLERVDTRLVVNNQTRPVRRASPSHTRHWIAHRKPALSN